MRPARHASARQQSSAGITLRCRPVSFLNGAAPAPRRPFASNQSPPQSTLHRALPIHSLATGVSKSSLKKSVRERREGSARRETSSESKQRAASLVSLLQNTKILMAQSSEPLDSLAEPTQAVKEQARAVIDFWFGLPPKKHFAKDAALDAVISTRFGALLKTIVAEEAAGWRGSRDALLAAVLVLDQFSRNIYRNTAEAFAADRLARSLTVQAITRGWDSKYPTLQRAFLYMPLMHAEDEAFHALSLERFATLGNDDFLSFARTHQEVIARFGRYPSRNEALGRSSTSEEHAYLKNKGPGW